MLYKSDICKKKSVCKALAAIPFEFDLLHWHEPGFTICFEPREEFTIIAGDYCGGVYLIFDSGNDGVFHVSSEAKASRIGDNLEHAIEHIASIPNWKDVAHSDFKIMAERILKSDDRLQSDWTETRDFVGSKLGIDVRSDHSKRLHESLVAGTEKNVLVNGNATINGLGIFPA